MTKVNVLNFDTMEFEEVDQDLTEYLLKVMVGMNQDCIDAHQREEE